jgi:hypothetical protein
MAPRMARSRRRSRLRVTAGPTARLIAKATCGGATLGSSTNEHHIAPLRTRTPSRLRRVNESRSQTRRIESGGEACAALVTAGLQHSASSAGTHAGAESMLTVPATVVGLKCALHDVLFRTFRISVPGGNMCPGGHFLWTDQTRLRRARRVSQPPPTATWPACAAESASQRLIKEVTRAHWAHRSRHRVPRN